MAISPNCFRCKNTLLGNTISYALCKAFHSGVPRPYGMPPSPYYDLDNEEPEISIRNHSIFTPIQENNYIFEQNPATWEDYLRTLYHPKINKEINQYDVFTPFFNYNPFDFYDPFDSLFITATGEAKIEGRETYPSTCLADKWQEFLLDWEGMFGKDVEINAEEQNKIFSWLSTCNQSAEAQKLWHALFPKIADFHQRFYMFRYDNNEEQIKDTEIKAFFECIQEMPCPTDFYMPRLSRLVPYILDFLNLGYTNILQGTKELYLGRKEIDILSENIGDLSYLSVLCLISNRLKDLPASLAKLTNLKFIDLSQNLFEVLPISIAQLQNLERLDVYGNHLTILPDELCDLAQLNRLDLYYNQLTHLPSKIGNLQNLQWFGLNHNRLQNLPDSFTNLQNLQGLYLTDNQFTSIPSVVFGLKKVEFLYFSRNQISVLPSEIERLKNLRWLGLSGNQITKIPDELVSLPHLEWLDLRDNPLSDQEKERLKELLPFIELLF